MAEFLFVVCQVGAEKAVREEVARRWKAFRFAFSRPGFLTFKLPPDHRLEDDFDLESVFARACGFSLGEVGRTSQSVQESGPSGRIRKSVLQTGRIRKSVLQTPEELAAQIWQISKGRTFQRIHVWEKDRAEPGDRGFEPGITQAARDAHQLLLRTCPYPASLAKTAGNLTHPARSGECVLDCVMLEPDQWWAGWHRAGSFASRYPGGMLSLDLPPEAVSRAWLKMEEALRWSMLPIPRGARVAELGSAPGGASQALLSRGFLVTGVDPAEMAPAVLADPRFTHIRRRSTQVRRREFRKVRWLTADMNVAPDYTLDAIESIVTHPEVSVRGLLLTLKLPEWRLASRVPDYLDRVGSWGYNIVRARQLQYNRREICVSALQKPFRRKSPMSS